MLLALSAAPEEVEVLLISLTFGNIEVRRLVYTIQLLVLDTLVQVFLPIATVPNASVVLQLSPQCCLHDAYSRARDPMAS